MNRSTTTPRTRAAVIGPAAAALTAALLAGCTGSAGGTAQDAGLVTGTATTQDGTAIAYRDYGGQGPAIVLLTGLGNSAAVYDDFAPRLTDGNRVVAITRRGFGDSDKPATGYDLATRATDNLAVLDELGIDEAVFVGHSVAGSEMGELAAEHADRVRGMVFLDATGQALTEQELGDLEDCWATMERWFPEPPAGGADPLADLVAAEQARFPFPLPASARTELDAVTEIEDDGTVTWNASIAGWNELSEAVADFTEVAAPALAVVAVTRDPAVLFPWITPQSAPAQVVAEAARCGTLIGDSAEADIAALDTANADIEVEVWPDFPHYVFLQDPAATEAAIEDWLTRSGLD